MKKNVWIMNHYAGSMFFDKGGRHYNFAKYLRRAGYEPVIFCANSKHGQQKLFFDNNELCHEHIAEEIDTPFVFVKARPYQGNGKQRVLNMVDFYRNVKKAAKQYAKEYGTPDIIYASSVHPLTLVAGIQLAKCFGVKCICEVRDLWPESIVAYSKRLTKKNPIIKLLYQGEKWIYERADRIIMTWPGGYDYIRNQGWDSSIDASKVIHISNGVDLQSLYFGGKNAAAEMKKWPKDKKLFIYTGSIRKVNNLKMLVDTAEELQKRGNNTAFFLIYGDGEEMPWLQDMVQEKKLTNIRFAGRVSKSDVPALLQASYATVLHNSSTILDRYGQSQNKFFEYLAAGRPILMTYAVGHSVIQKNKCGFEVKNQTVLEIANAVEKMCSLNQVEYDIYCKRCIEVSHEFDFAKLTQKLIDIIEG